MTRRLYPIGIQTFSEIRRQNMAYIDKTEYVYRMTHTDGKFLFLSRPRRFGKSLLVSTLYSYFSGAKDLFKGLAIEKLEKEWNSYPVLLFSMAGGKHMEKEQLERFLLNALNENEKKYGIESDSIDTNVRLRNLIVNVYEKTNKPVVVLIDEYDAPLLDIVHEEACLPDLRNVMRNFFSPLKDSEPYLRFVFLTGITKFSQLSIFSELNNIRNISMDENYAGICGITKEELLTQMLDDIDNLAQRRNLSREQTIQQLKERYDGYHFSWPSPDVFNPYSLINCFADGKLRSYWFGSGTPTYLVEMMKKFEVDPSTLHDIKAKESSFDAPTENMSNIMPLLYQSGYITIKDYNEDLDFYTLDIPNLEIRSGLFENLLPFYLDRTADKGKIMIAEMSAYINKGDISGAMELLATFIETVPYCDNTHYEGHYQQMMFVIFAILTDYRINVEQRTSKGRTDITLETATHIYIMELKFNSSAESALKQINDMRYAEAFALSGKQIIKVGINFCVKENRNITQWVIG